MSFAKQADRHFDQIEAQLRQLQADCDVRSMGNVNDQKDAELGQLTTTLAELKEQTRELKDKEKKATRDMESALQDADEDVIEEMREKQAEDYTYNQIYMMREEAQADLDGLIDIPADVLIKYEQRQKKIDRYKLEARGIQTKLDVVLEVLEKLKGRWYPKLKRLVGRVDDQFSSAMDKLGLNGEVRLAEDDPNFENWGIEILVKFRDKEPLQVLTSHRQSGGERALATAVYVMAMQEVVNSPILLVDEINQGMDRNYERSVHNAFVKSSCRDSVGQSFLLTPKLLPNLDTHPKMKVLVIHNVSFGNATRIQASR
ncbi:hypothetical protein T439DRAFT_169242 [Meredithblackwellia eburnea MCA 4105]